MSGSPARPICIALLLSTLVALNHGCGLSPSLWCSSLEAAKRCQVVEQCVALSSWGATPVNVTLFYESLCPDCKRFFITQLSPTWSLLADTGILHLELVPFGNAEESWSDDHWEFNCQHGPDECSGNIIETCAISKIGDMKAIMTFIGCMEESELKPNKSGPLCALKHNIDYKPIQKCSEGLEGNGLEHEMAVRTNQLSPPHEYVPWVTVNGVHTEAMEKEAESNLLKLICDTYQGPKPAACTSSVRGCHRETPKKRLVTSGGGGEYQPIIL